MTKRLIFLSAFFFIAMLSMAQQKTAAQKWVDDTYKKLNQDQRIAQLIIIRAYSNKGIEANVV